MGTYFNAGPEWDIKIQPVHTLKVIINTWTKSSSGNSGKIFHIVRMDFTDQAVMHGVDRNNVIDQSLGPNCMPKVCDGHWYDFRRRESLYRIVINRRLHIAVSSSRDPSVREIIAESPWGDKSLVL